MCLEHISQLKTAEEDIVVYKRLIRARTFNPNKVKTGIPITVHLNVARPNDIISAIAVIERNVLYICSNYSALDGTNCTNKLGCLYSWQLDNTIVDITINKESILLDGIVTCYQEYPITIGETYTANMKVTNDEVNEGLHSFDKLQAAKDDSWATGESSRSIYCKCIIPKGASYYSGSFNNTLSYASDKLTYLELITD